MAKQMIKGLAMLAMIVTLSLVTSSAAKGQSSNRQVANIPFEFIVGNSEMQAGKYSVEQAGSDGAAVKISGTEQAAFRLSTTITSSRRAEKGQLVFHRYGNRYFLAEIWTPGESEGRQLLKSKDEKAVEREWAVAQNHRQHERIEIALARK